MSEVTTTPTTVAYRDEGFLAAGISASTTTITVGAIYKNPSGVRTQQGFDSTAGYAEISYGDRYEVISFGAASVNATTKVTTLTDVRRGLPQTNTTASFTAGTGLVWPKGATIRVIDYSNYHHQTAFKDKANTFTENLTLATTKELRLGGSDRAIYDDGTEVYIKSGTTAAKSLAELAAAGGSDEKAAISANDTTPDYLVNKITGGDGITVTETDDAGDETLDIDIDLATTSHLTLSGGKLAVDTTTGVTVPTGGVLMWTTASAPTGFLLCDGSAVSRTTYSALFSVVSTTFGTGDGSTTFNVPDMRGRFPLGVGTGTKDWAISSIDAGTDILTVPSNTALQTGQAVVYTAASPASGLTSTSTYYVIRVSATTIKLAESRANALAGSAINLTSTGSGTQTLTQTFTARTLADIGGEEEHSLTSSELPAHTHPFAPAVQTTQSGGSGNVIRVDDASSGTGSFTTSSNTGGDGPHNNMPPFLAVNYIIKT